MNNEKVIVKFLSASENLECTRLEMDEIGSDTLSEGLFFGKREFQIPDHYLFHVLISWGKHKQIVFPCENSQVTWQLVNRTREYIKDYKCRDLRNAFNLAFPVENPGNSNMITGRFTDEIDDVYFKNLQIINDMLKMLYFPKIQPK